MITDKTEQRNTSKEKKKENKKYPYKRLNLREKYEDRIN